MTLTERLRMELFARVMERWGARITRALQRRHKGDDAALINAYQAALGIAADQPSRMHRAVDQITILECAFGYQATKRITAMTPEGVGGYKCGTWFATTTAEVGGLADLASLLEAIQHKPRMFVIRGQLIEGHHPGRVRKKSHTDKDDPAAPYFSAKRRRHLAGDLDSFDLPAGVNPLDVRAVAEVGRSLLPPEFQRASAWAQLTASAGIEPGGRCRLWFWLSRPVSDDEAKHWLKGAPVDTSLLHAVQPHYTALPGFSGLTDPAPARSIVLHGEVDTVVVPPRLAQPAEAVARRFETSRRREVLTHSHHVKVSPSFARQEIRKALAAIRGTQGMKGARLPAFKRWGARALWFARAGGIPRATVEDALYSAGEYLFDHDQDRVARNVEGMMEWWRAQNG